jgi:acyl-CoA reductase-like NAD-dependent aldehyde dehydrogenase
MSFSVRFSDLFIDNEFVPSTSGKTYEVINPTTEEVLARVAEGQDEDVDRVSGQLCSVSTPTFI